MHVLILYGIFFILSILLIYEGGKVLINSSIILEDIAGIHGFVIGATIVSAATTIPELLVATISTLQGSIDMATGNAIGSVICNAGLIMGISIFMMPLKIKNNLFAKRGFYLIFTAALLELLIADRRLDVADSLVLIAILVFFIFTNLMLGRRAVTERIPQNKDKMLPPRKRDILRNIRFVLYGAILLIAGAKLMVVACTGFVEEIGIKQNIIALTIMSLGTSIPEVVTAVVAIRRGEMGMAYGGILGSSVINIGLILPLCTLLNKGVLVINPQAMLLDIPVMLVLLLIAVIPGVISNKLSRTQGAVLMLVLFMYMTYVMGNM
jgi:cation:H+ antiporter